MELVRTRPGLDAHARAGFVTELHRDISGGKAGDFDGFARRLQNGRSNPILVVVDAVHQEVVVLAALPGAVQAQVAASSVRPKALDIAALLARRDFGLIPKQIQIRAEACRSIERLRRYGEDHGKLAGFAFVHDRRGRMRAGHRGGDHDGISAGREIRREVSAALVGDQRTPEAILADQPRKAREALDSFVQILGRENFFLELHDHGIEDQQRRHAEPEQQGVLEPGRAAAAGGRGRGGERAGAGGRAVDPYPPPAVVVLTDDRCAVFRHTGRAMI